MANDGQFDDAPIEFIGLKFEKEMKLEEEFDDDFDSDFSDEGYDDDFQVRGGGGGRVGGGNMSLQSSAVNVKSFQPTEKLFKKFANKINVDKYEGPALNILQEQSKKNDKVNLGFPFKLLEITTSIIHNFYHTYST